MKTCGLRSSTGKKNFCVWIFLAAATICLIPVVKALKCPPAKDKDKDGNCICGSDSIMCSSVVSQTFINDYFSKLRVHNGLAPTDTLELSSFELTLSTLTTFDLTPLLRTKLTYFDIIDNDNLTRLVGPADGTGDGLIDARQLRLGYNSFTGEGFDMAFKLFNGPRVNKIDFTYNRVKEIPGLSTFTNLEEINLYQNHISELKAEWFRGLTSILELKLVSNPVEFVRESALLFDPPPNDQIAKRNIVIQLTSSKLKSENFSPKSGIDKSKRAVFLAIGTNFETLLQNVFEPFLDANPENVVNLEYNKDLVCDPRVKWLQDRKDEFEKKVGGEGECSNDPGKTVWNSEKVRGVKNSGWSISRPGPETGISICVGSAMFYMYFFA